MKNLVLLMSLVVATNAHAETGAAFTTVEKAGKTKDTVIVSSSTLNSGQSSTVVKARSGTHKDVITLEIRANDGSAIEMIECFESGNKAYKNNCLPIGSLTFKKAPTLLALTANFKMRELVGEMIATATKKTETEALRKTAKKMNFNDYAVGMRSLHDGFAEMEYQQMVQKEQK